MVTRHLVRHLLRPAFLALTLLCTGLTAPMGHAGPAAADVGQQGAPTIPPAGAVLAERSSHETSEVDRPSDAATPAIAGNSDTSTAGVGGPAARAAAAGAAAASTRPGIRSTPVVATSTAPSNGRKGTAAAKYHGRNHVWMPALHIDRSVAGYACSNSAYPGNRVYRWGCAGDNNVYLFGHAHSVFKALHDAYVKGSLKKGMELFYADGAGKVHRYVIAWWKVTTPTRGTWAYAPLDTPSLTLQTCLGATSQYRLIVRLTRAD